MPQYFSSIMLYFDLGAGIECDVTIRISCLSIEVLCSSYFVLQIGNWSRWLTDLFGLEDDSTEQSDVRGHGKKSKSFKAFRLLHSLSDLMMLPFGMLADASTRKEVSHHQFTFIYRLVLPSSLLFSCLKVCPMFGPRIIERVLTSFVPDEFCPDPIPQDIIDALETEVSTSHVLYH